MYAAQAPTQALMFAPAESRPRTVPLLMTIAIHAALILGLASGLGMIHISLPPVVMTAFNVPTKQTPPQAAETPLAVDRLAFAERVDAPIEPVVEIDKRIIVSDDPPPYRISDVEPVTEVSFAAARLLRKFEPQYPAQSRRLDEQGIVTLLLTISPDGRVAQAQVQSSSGYTRLDQAAIDSVRNWLFTPARRGEQAIVYTVSVPIRFELNRG